MVLLSMKAQQEKTNGTLTESAAWREIARRMLRVRDGRLLCIQAARIADGVLIEPAMYSQMTARCREHVALMEEPWDRAVAWSRAEDSGGRVRCLAALFLALEAEDEAV